jgi:hypothetical protein
MAAISPLPTTKAFMCDVPHIVSKDQRWMSNRWNFTESKLRRVLPDNWTRAIRFALHNANPARQTLKQRCF